MVPTCNQPPHAACRGSRECHGDPYWPHPHCLLSAIATLCHMCHFQVLLTLLVGSMFVIGCCMASIPLLLP
ncbi:unnamed protein product, partial [Staurois parvus]